MLVDLSANAASAFVYCCSSDARWPASASKLSDATAVAAAMIRMAVAETSA